MSSIIEDIFNALSVGPTAATQQADVDAKLEARNKAKGGNLNWGSSIVDLMKTLDLDSSLDNRKRLAQELGYTEELRRGSAEMNQWLHREIMKRLRSGGGNIPTSLEK